MVLKSNQTTDEMTLKDYLIDFAKFLLRIIIVAALLFGPAILAVVFMEPRLLLLYIVSVAIISLFLINYFKPKK